jgi:hypothetical protein
MCHHYMTYSILLGLNTLYMDVLGLFCTFVIPQDVKSDANQVADQAISLAKLVRAFAAEDWEKEHYDRYNTCSIT